MENIRKLFLTHDRVCAARRALYSLFHPHQECRIIFVFGCQRSGTTILAQIVGSSPLVKRYGEGDAPYFFPEEGPGKLRLRPPEPIRDLLTIESSPFILLKPLYESQNAASLRNAYEGARSIWIFRHFLDVVDSHIKYYGVPGEKYISDLFSTKMQSWKNERLSPYAQRLITTFQHRPLNSASSFALFWLIRNSFFFECGRSDRNLIVQYENLVTNPESEIERIFAFLGIPYRRLYSSIVHKNAVAKTISFDLDREVLNECQSMYVRLQAACSGKEA